MSFDAFIICFFITIHLNNVHCIDSTYNLAEGSRYNKNSRINSIAPHYNLYCDEEHECMCNEESGRYVFHCERKLHLQLTWTMLDIMTADIRCNETIEPYQLKHNYSSILRLERFTGMRWSLSLTGCPEPSTFYSSLMAPGIVPYQRVSQPKLFQLKIDCGERKEFSFVKGHFKGLSELQYLEISCSGLKHLPGDIFRGNLPNLLILNISNTLMEVIPEGLFTDLSNLTTLILNWNRLIEIRSEDFSGLNSLVTLSIKEVGLRNIKDDVFNDVLNLKYFSLDLSKLTTLPNSFGNLVNLISISMVNNSIESIEKHHCERLENLMYIGLEYNSIKYIDPVCFSKFKKVTAIYFNGNSLSNLPEEPFPMDYLNSFFLNDNKETIERVYKFIVSKTLQEVAMDNSKIESFDPDFLHSMPNLRVFSAMGNNITHLDETFFMHNPKIRTVLLNNNKISMFSENFFMSNPKLSILFLSRNNISFLPPTLISNCRFVVRLSLDHNIIENIPTSFFSNSITLQRLNISYNKIKTLTIDSFTGLENLHILDLSYNLLPNLTINVFWPFKRLRVFYYLNLEGNKISYIVPLHLPSLQYLNLANNNLTKLEGIHFMNLRKVQFLNLSRNALEILSNTPLVHYGRLVELDLSFNRLHEIPPRAFSQVSSIKRLILSGNKIEVLDLCGIHEIRYLTELDLSSNGMHYINDISACGARLNHVKILNLSNNRLNFNYTSWVFDNLRKTWGRISPLLCFPDVEEINLANNSISTIFMDWRNMFLSLRKLNLSHNKLDHLTHQDMLFSNTKVYKYKMEELYECSYSLEIDLSYNLIRSVELPPDMLTQRPTQDSEIYSNVTILMEGNHFDCGCGIRKFFKMMDGDIILTSELSRTEGKNWILPARINAENLCCY